MGYRNYIGSIPKRHYNAIKSLNKEELSSFYSIEDVFDEMGVYDFNIQQVYELGKYVDFPIPKGSQKTFFKNKEVREYYNSDTEIHIVTKEFLAAIINDYQESIKNYYSEYYKHLMNDSGRRLNHNLIKRIPKDSDEPDEKEYQITLTKGQINGIAGIMSHGLSLYQQWDNIFGSGQFVLDVGDQVTQSWLYEYAIFELVRIYKSFDWKRNYMVYYGH